MSLHLRFHSTSYLWTATVALALLTVACGDRPSVSPAAPSALPAPQGAPSAAPEATPGATSAQPPGEVFTPLASVPPVFTPSNPNCQSLGYGFEAKIDPADPGTVVHTVAGIGSITLTVDGDDRYFDWTSTFGIDAVIAKGGQDAHVYVYDPPAESTGDTRLNPPINPSTQMPFGISHVSFCYDINLAVSKTVVTTFTRDYDWTIGKSAGQSSLVLEPGQQTVVNYQVTVVKDPGTDRAWSVSGTISVTNPHPSAAATGVAVVDTISGVGTMSVNCPSRTIAAGATMVCTYGPAALPNGSPRTISATATTATSGIGSGTGSHAVAFGSPSTVLDNCVNISDTFAGSLGSVCASQTFNYPRTVSASALQCGANTVTNTASLATDDGSTEQSTANVGVTVDCQSSTGGCALSAGYWRRHSIYGPSPYDATWAAIGENTAFYLSGRSYYEQIDTPAGGNAYNVLAFQFIAAKLNMAAGADAPSGVDLEAIEAFFKTYTPADAAQRNNGRRKQAIGWARALEAYNTGQSNVDHCSR